MQGLMQVGWSEWVEWTGNNCGPVAGKCQKWSKMVKFRSCHWNGMAMAINPRPTSSMDTTKSTCVKREHRAGVCVCDTGCRSHETTEQT